MKHALAMFGLLLPGLVNACINADHPRYEEYQITRVTEPLLASLNTTPEDRFANHHDAPVDDFTKLQREAIEKIRFGKYEGAIKQLNAIEKQFPGQYETAANLGTAYELAGKNHAALKWIQEGVERNAHSHAGSEWIHVNILEAKIKLEQDPDYLSTNKVLALKDSIILENHVAVNNAEIPVEEVTRMIHYQLQERMVFIKEDDPVVADLLFTMADLYETQELLGVSQKVLELSKRFAPDQMQSMNGSNSWRSLNERQSPGSILGAVFSEPESCSR
ncbi:MAG: hypothetical protein AAFX93_13340 [Verrucomicrobiota bacterium]